jgi:hypothetical protein
VLRGEATNTNIISLKINLFSPWYSWKIAELALNNNHSLQTMCLFYFLPFLRYVYIISSKHNFFSQFRKFGMTLKAFGSFPLLYFCKICLILLYMLTTRSSNCSRYVYIISSKHNFFSPWYSWKIAELALNNNHSLQTMCLSNCSMLTLALSVNNYTNSMKYFYLQEWVSDCCLMSFIVFNSDIWLLVICFISLFIFITGAVVVVIVW